MEEEVEHFATATDTFLACSMCRRLLREAVQLKCLHNCCRQCFSAAASKDGCHEGVSCGSCGAVTQVGSEKPNEFVDCQVKRYMMISESRTCGKCRENGEHGKPALVWCPACRHSLCGDCVAAHRQYNRQHVTQSFEELKSLDEVCLKPSAAACAIHYKPLDIACLSCEQVKCINCWASCKEKKHEVHIVSDVSFDNYVVNLVAGISTIERELLLKSAVLIKPRSLLRDTKAARDCHLEDLSTRKRRVVDAVEMAYEKMALATKDAYDDIEAEREVAADAAERIASDLSEARDYIRRLVESNEKVEIFRQHKNVRGRLSALSAELDNLSDRLATTTREVKIEASLPEDVEDVVRSWIGIPRLYSVPSLSAPTTLKERQHFSFGVASAAIKLPVECYDVALTQDGRRLLLAANEHGLMEFSSIAGREMSRWRPPKLSDGKDDLVQGVAALSERQVAVGVFWAKLVAILRRNERSGIDGTAAGDAWIECRRLDQLPWPPRRLSSHGNVLAVTEDKRDEKQKRWLPGSRLQLMSVSGGRQRLSAERQREYSIRDMAVAARVVVTGSLGKVKLSFGRNEARVLDAHSLTDGDERLWRYELSNSVDEITYGICADSAGGCLYAAVLRSDLSCGRVTALSLADGSELRRVALSFGGPHLLPVLLSLSDDESVDGSEQPSSTGNSSRGALLLAALCWDPKTKQQRTVTVHRSERE